MTYRERIKRKALNDAWYVRFVGSAIQRYVQEAGLSGDDMDSAAMSLAADDPEFVKSFPALRPEKRGTRGR